VASTPAKPEHEIAYQELIELVNKHAGKLDSRDMLAIAANMLGKLIALQDHRKVTPAMAMKIVAKNIELGNTQALAEISGKPAGKA
jgi:hypothetical protein